MGEFRLTHLIEVRRFEGGLFDDRNRKTKNRND